MPNYRVTIEATVRKTYDIEATDRDAAMQQANEQFSVLNEPEVDEYYDQQVIDIEEE